MPCPGTPTRVGRFAMKNGCAAGRSRPRKHDETGGRATWPLKPDRVSRKILIRVVRSVMRSGGLTGRSGTPNASAPRGWAESTRHRVLLHWSHPGLCRISPVSRPRGVNSATANIVWMPSRDVPDGIASPDDGHRSGEHRDASLSLDADRVRPNRRTRCERGERVAVIGGPAALAVRIRQTAFDTLPGIVTTPGIHPPPLEYRRLTPRSRRAAPPSPRPRRDVAGCTPAQRQPMSG
jgi:hypothetical protein